MSRPDRWGDLGRIGILTPDIDVGPESEFWTMAPAGVSIHAGRVPFRWRGEMQAAPLGLEPVRAFVEPPRMDDAAELLAAAPVNVICVAFTSHSYVIGPDGDEQLRARLERRTHGIPVLSGCPSSVVALRALGVQSLALVNPPWFTPELDRLGAEYFGVQGFQVAYAAHVELDRGQLNVRPSEVYEWLVPRVPPEAEALFIGGNGFRVVSTIQELERGLGRPVITDNQALLWHALQVGGIEAHVTAFGRIFAQRLGA